jgi:hypothetical protein
MTSVVTGGHFPIGSGLLFCSLLVLVIIIIIRVEWGVHGGMAFPASLSVWTDGVGVLQS